MTRDEIERYLTVGLSRCVDVEVALVPEFPGYVRTVTLRAGNIVTVELNAHGTDEGGPIFNASYESLDDALKALEGFISKPPSEWVNFSTQGEYPELAPGADLEEGHRLLRDALVAGAVRLPQGDFRLQDDGYWSRAAER